MLLHQEPLLGVCQWCGQQLERVRVDARYCSAAHKQAHYRWRGRLLVKVMEASVAINQVAEYRDHPFMRESAREELVKLLAQVKSALK